jgi:hypothetical protein
MHPIVLLATLAAVLPADTLSERMTNYRSAPDAETRVRALEEVAELARSPEPPEPGALCKALAEGLDDELYTVRARAVALVAAGPAAVAARELLAATKAQMELEDEIREHVSSLTLPKADLDLFSPSKKKRERSQEDLEQLVAATKELQAWLEERADVPEVRAALIEAWPTVADASAVTGLGLLFEHGGFAGGADGIVDGLLSIGTAPALEALVQHVDRYEDALKERDARARELKRMKPGKKPNDLWADEVWERKERKRIDEQRSTFEERCETEDAWMEGFVERLRAFGLAHDLAPAPRALKPARNWLHWASRSREQLPAGPQ